MKLASWDITPFTSVGPVAFGRSRQEVRQLLGPGVSTFNKGPGAATETDVYDALGAHFYYDDSERLECVEIMGPITVRYRGISLINVPIADVLQQLRDAGISYRFDDGYFVDESGFVIYAPSDTVKAVTIYRKGYY
jgi:hypothetical protein